MIEYDTASVLSKCGAVHAFFEVGSGADHGLLNVAKSVGPNKENAIQNRKLALEAIGLEASNLVYASKLGHGDRILEVTTENAGKEFDDLDALVTRDNVAIGLSVADCVPILMMDPVKRVVAVAHAGWRSTVKQIGPKTVKYMQEHHGSKPEDIRAGMGPCICQAHFEVGDEVAEQFNEKYLSETEGKKYVDLLAANFDQLKSAGLKYVDEIGRCTYEDPDLFSHRRDNNAGRMLAVIALPN